MMRKYRPPTKKDKKNKKASDQENHNLIKAAMKEQFKEMMAMMKTSRSKKNVPTGTAKRVSTKKRKQAEDDLTSEEPKFLEE